jgi:hypothetical protein
MKPKSTLFVVVFAVALFGVGCASTGTSKDPLKEGLVGWFPFNGHSADESGKGNHGAVSGAVLVADKHVKKTGAYQFVGNSCYFKVKGVKGCKSASFWVFINTKQTGNSNSNGRYLIGWRNKDGKGGYVLTDTSFFRGTLAKFYLDGKPFEPSKIAIPREKWIQVYMEFPDSLEHSESLTLMNKQTGGEGLNGILDDVRIYNRALSADEVKALYNLEKPKAK